VNKTESFRVFILAATNESIPCSRRSDSVGSAKKSEQKREREGLGRGGGEGLLGLILAGYVPLASQSPYPIIVFSVDDEKSKDYCKADTT